MCSSQTKHSRYVNKKGTFNEFDSMKSYTKFNKFAQEVIRT